jgi:hypothetical protein
MANNTGTWHAEQPHHIGMEGKQVLGARSLQSDEMVDLTPWLLYAVWKYRPLCRRKQR